MSNVIIMSYIIIMLGILIFYYYLSKKKILSSNYLFLTNQESKIIIKKNNITPVFIFCVTFFVYSSIGLSNKFEEYTAVEVGIFVLCCIFGMISFLFGYGLDSSVIIKNKKNNKIHLLSNKKINYIEIILLIVFVINCIIFRDKLFEMIMNFGSGKEYSEYAIRDERTSFTGIESAFSSYFTLLLLLFPFYRSFYYKKIHILDVFIYLIVFSYAFFSGNRTNVLIIFLLLVVIVNNRFFCINMPTILIGLVIGVLFFVLIGHLRVYNNFDEMLNMLKNGKIIDLISVTSSGEFKNTTNTTFSYIHSISTGDSFFDFGYIYLLDILMYIPTFILSSRPLPPAEQYMLEFFPNAQSGTGHAWFILTDGYRALGIFGIIIEMYLFGKLIRYIYKKFFENNSNPLVNFMYVYFLLYIFYSVRSSSLLSIKNYLIAVAPVLIVLIIYKFLTKEDILKKEFDQINHNKIY